MINWLIEINCLNCGGKCTAVRRVYEKRGYGFCGHSCSQKYHMNRNHPFKGKKHTEESRRKMSEKLKGKYSLSPEAKQRQADAIRGEKNYRWKGGKTRHGGGYVLINSGDKEKRQVLEHRLVMERYLGRALDPSEVIHHINGDKTDNRIENLELLSCQSEHAKLNPIPRDGCGRFAKSPLYERFPIQEWPEGLRKGMEK